MPGTTLSEVLPILFFHLIFITKQFSYYFETHSSERKPRFREVLTQWVESQDLTRARLWDLENIIQDSHLHLNFKETLNHWGHTCTKATNNLGHTYTKKKNHLFVWNSHCTGHPVFYLATQGRGIIRLSHLYSYKLAWMFHLRSQLYPSCQILGAPLQAPTGSKFLTGFRCKFQAPA